MKKIKVFSITLFLAVIGVACQPAPQLITEAPTEPATVTPGVVHTPIPSSTPQPTSTISQNENLLPPPLLYITNDRLIEQQPDGTPREISDLGDQGDVFSAVRVGDDVFVLRQMGLQRVDLGSGKTRMLVAFKVPPLYGELVRSADDRVVLYSTALESSCSSTGIGAQVGVYQVEEEVASRIMTRDEGYLKPLGLTTDQKSFYGLPVGCDPEFDRFWLVSMANGDIQGEITTSDEVNREFGEEYAALSPDARLLAFSSSRYVEAEDTLRYRLSVIHLETSQIERFELPGAPSHIWGGMLWSPEGRWVYFVVNPGAPSDELPSSLGLWGFDAQEKSFHKVSDLDNPFTHLLSISGDGKWLLVQPEAERRVVYVYLPTGEWFVVSLPPEGVGEIVR